MKKWILVCRQIFAEFVRFNLFFTLICLYMLLSYGERSNGYLPLIKLAGYATTFLHFYFNKRSRLYLFYNLGCGVRQLILVSLTMDLIILFLTLSLTNLIHP